MKPKIRIDFCDLGANFCKTDNYLFRVLSQKYDLRICDQPDFLIYDVAGHSYRLHSGVRIRYTCESSLPDYNEADYSMGPIQLDDPRHLYSPGYLPYGNAADILKQNDKPEQILSRKSKFCSFMVSSHNPRKNQNRLDIFNALTRYKRVDSAGRFMNNIGGPLPGKAEGKLAFLQDYKFNIVYENAIRPGYITEKIFQAMHARCIPIFWGDSSIDQHFNPNSFLDRSKFASDEALAERVRELDQDDAKYLEFMRQPYLPNDRPTSFFDPKTTLDFFEKVFTTPIEPKGRKRKWFQMGRWIPVKRYHLHPLPKWDGGER